LRSESYVWDKPPVHNIDLDAVHAGSLNGKDLFAKSRKIG
jgi:hypothetical protein